MDYAANLDSFPELTQEEININQGAAVYQAEVAVLAINNTGVTTIERQMELVEAGTGGGSGSAFAVIAVSYPPGSICTCTDGIKTFTAKDTSGQVLFIIPYAATWTVTATDGTNNKSQSVEISSEGQFESVVLKYRSDYYINGVKYIGMEPIKDSVGNYGTVTENADHVFIDSDGYSVAVGYISSESVDLSGATKLVCKITGLAKNNSNSDNGLRMSVCGTKTPYHNGERSDLVVINISSAELDNGTYVLDVSQITSGYIGVYSYGFYVNLSEKRSASFNLVEFYSE